LIKKLLLASKAADLAILNGRKTIIEQDVITLSRLCIPGLICFRSLLLDNEKISSVVLTPRHVEMLESIEIQKNKHLSETSNSDILDKIYLQPSDQNVPVDKNRLKEKISIWNSEYKLLENYLDLKLS
jgi:hypothetical protein